jgi:hypothetical protein
MFKFGIWVTELCTASTILEYFYYFLPTFLGIIVLQTENAAKDINREVLQILRKYYKLRLFWLRVLFHVLNYFIF